MTPSQAIPGASLGSSPACRAVLGGFAWLAIVMAAGAGAVGLLMTLALGEPQIFEQLLDAVASRFSRTGVISPEGQDILRRTMRLLMRLSGVVAIAAVTTAILIRRLLRDQIGPDEDDAHRVLSRPAWEEDAWWRPHRIALAALGLMALAAALRIPRLSTSLFYDEIFTMQHFVTMPLINIPFIQTEGGASNHILNSMLLHVSLWFSPDEGVLRTPMFLAGVASLWLFYSLTADLGGPLAGLLALAWAGTSDYHMHYSTLARGYMPGLSLMLLGLIIFLKTDRPSGWGPLLACGVAQGLAIWAMPTLAIVPLALAAFLLMGALPAFRSLVMLDSRRPVGIAWLLVILGVLAVMGTLQLPYLPYMILHAAGTGAPSSAGGGSWSGASDWIGMFHHGVVGTLIGLGLGAIGLVVLWGQYGSASWKMRAVLFLWLVSVGVFALKPEPARIHVILFAALVVLLAIGSRALLMGAVNRWSPPSARPWVSAGLSLILIAGIAVTSWSGIVAAAHGVPFQDVRGAVRTAEAMLTEGQEIVTSGFAGRELTYYAHRAVEVVSPGADPASLPSRLQTFCYFRLYGRLAEPSGIDPVYDYFKASGSPTVVLPGEDPIAVWCFREGHPVPVRGAGIGRAPSVSDLRIS